VRSILAVFGVYVLGLLLAGTFPLGAGDAVHGGSLLHPAFPHSHGQLDAAATSQRSPKPTLETTWDSSAGGAAESPSTGLAPPLPKAPIAMVILGDARLVARELPWPAGRREPPPDPPPLPNSV
jgi:hypothetical protein